MRVNIACVDFSTMDAVGGVRLTCTIKLVPRITRVLGGEEVGPPVLVENQAVTLPSRSATADAEGNARFDIDAASEYARLIAANEHNERFFDLVALVRLRGSVDGLENDSPFVLLANSRQSPTGDVERNQRVLMDFAKSIVGHTTDHSCRLWFQLHGAQLADRRYECEVRPASPGTPGEQVARVSFSEQRARTTIVDVNGLEAGREYEYRLWSRRPGSPAGDRVFCQGSFQTVDGDARELTVLFGSCHKPLDTGVGDPVRELRHWRRLADRSDGDVQLFIGDQMYGDEVSAPAEGDQWFDGYVRRYNALWAYQPMRQALSRRPTYMTLDDHEVKDDWGVDDNIPRERIADGTKAFRSFQLAHSPSGYDGTVHYHFRRGPVAFFVMDGRTERGKDDEFPIFGRRQWREFVAWASSAEARTADVIVFASSVPVALLPIEQLRDIAENAATVAGSILGGIFGGPAGLLIGAAGASIAYDAIEEDQLMGNDATDMWALEANQKDMSRLLNVLFALANDLNLSDPDGAPGTRPRAVFVLGGDCHFGQMHVIASNRRGGPDHRRNPQVMHMTSSAIARPPLDDARMLALFEDLDETPPDYDGIVTRLVGLLSGKATEFVLDDEEDSHYRAAALGALFERTLGRLRIERIGAGRRYRFEATVEGETRSLVQLFEVDLEARPVQWRSLVGQILSLQGRLTMLRVNEVGGKFGPLTDRLDAEVIIGLDSGPDRFFGFRLRRNSDEQTHTQMFHSLRDALNHDRPVRIDYRRTGVRNGELIRINVLA